MVWDGGMVGSGGIVRSRGAIGGWRGSVRGRSRSVAILRGRAWAIGWSWAVSIYGSLTKNFVSCYILNITTFQSTFPTKSSMQKYIVTIKSVPTCM